jgi:hypothetical protein
MYIQAVVDLLIFVMIFYLIYRWIIKPSLKERQASKLLLKAQKLEELKNTEIELKGEVEVTEGLITKEKKIKKLNTELEKLETKEKEISGDAKELQ